MASQMLDLKEQINWRETKDYILLYNKLSERCFQSCVSTLYGNHLAENEISCVNACTLRYVAFNQRMMKMFLEHQQLRQRKVDSPVLSPISSAFTGLPLPENMEETNTPSTENKK